MIPQVVSVRPCGAAAAAVYWSLPMSYANELLMTNVFISDHLPRASDRMNDLANAKFGLVAPPQRSADETEGSPPDVVAPPSEALPGARQPEVSPGPLPRNSLVWTYLLKTSPEGIESLHLRVSSAAFP